MQLVKKKNSMVKDLSVVIEAWPWQNHMELSLT